MKFILLDISDSVKSIKCNEYELIEDKKIKEIILNKSKLNKISNLKFKEKKNIINKIEIKIYEWLLYKAIKSRSKKYGNDSEDIRYIYSTNLNLTSKQIRYLSNVMENMKIKPNILGDEMAINFFKYVDEYSIKNSINKEKLKILFVYKDINNINFNLITNAVKEYNKANIYLKGVSNKNLLNSIDKINEAEGCMIEIIKYNKKAFLDYDIIYYPDDSKVNYPRMRINKNALVIDLESSQIDKFNTNIIFLNNIKNNKDIINYLKDRYGLLPIANALKNMCSWQSTLF